jgi:hypothetical protein
VRDLALEVAKPLVLTVAPRGGFVDLARLTLEAARGSGLHVAAVVLTPWPDPPDRGQLDDRALLEGLAGVPVVTHPGDKGWDPDAWRAGATEAAAGPGGAAPVVLEPYTPWEERPVADPREAGRPAIMAALTEIVAAEGPILADRAYGLYNKASGGKKLTTIARAPLSGAAYWLVKEHKLVMDGDVLRLPDTPPVRVRTLGPRTLDEVPLAEVAELMRRLNVADPAARKRAVLDAYGLIRLTGKADEYLGEAAALLERSADSEE